MIAGMVVRVEPATVEWLEALVEGQGAFTERFGITVVPGWAVYPEAIVRGLDAARRGDDPAWGTHLFFDDDGALVGFGGFKGPPTAEGVVELGYAVAPERQGRGIATAVVTELVSRARSAGVTLVKGDLNGIVRARSLSEATLKNIRQNLFFAFVYNSLGVPIAAGVLYPFFGILLSPIIAAAAMSLSSVSVISNALRLKMANL